jgi:hypothetical protein
MEFDPFRMNIHQPDLLDAKKALSSRIEFSPDIWSAAESLSSPDLADRLAGLDYLEQREAVFYFPLVAYLLSTRICDPDIRFRARVVKALAHTLEPQDGEPQAVEDVKQQIHTSLSQMRNRQIYALLEVTNAEPEVKADAAVLMSYCSFAGEHLSDLLSERKTPLHLRKTALHFIEQIGYLDALPTLERLERRLKSKQNGRTEFDEHEEASLIPLIQGALECLQAP